MFLFFIFTFSIVIFSIGLFHARKPSVVSKRGVREFVENEKKLLDVLTERFGKERAEKIMEDRDYYKTRNEMIRKNGCRYRFDVDTGEWKLIFKGNPLYYK